MSITLDHGVTAATALGQAGGNRPGTPASQRLSTAAREFESILVNQWLQGAEASLGAAPDGQEDADADGDQMKGFAIQQLAQAISSKDCFGIRKLVQHGLEQLASSDAGRTSHSEDQTNFAHTRQSLHRPGFEVTVPRRVVLP